MLVAREDKKDITPEQVEALAHFCRYEISPAMYRFVDSREDFESEEFRRAKVQFLRDETRVLRSMPSSRCSRERSWLLRMEHGSVLSLLIRHDSLRLHAGWEYFFLIWRTNLGSLWESERKNCDGLH